MWPNPLRSVLPYRGRRSRATSSHDRVHPRQELDPALAAIANDLSRAFRRGFSPDAATLFLAARDADVPWDVLTTAVANGDSSKKITVDVRGEILELKDTINTMVDQLNSFASEVTRVAREVGPEGKLGGQAAVRGLGGTWKD